MKKNILHELPSRKRLGFGFAAAALVSFAVSALFFSFPSINVLEWRLADSWAQKAFGKRVSDKVVVIGVDEQLLNDFGWPLEKDIYGDLIGYLGDMGATGVVFDILFADNLDACGKGDSLFREIVGLTPGVVLCYAGLMDKSSPGKYPGRKSAIPPQFAVGKGTVPDWNVDGAVLPYPQLMRQAHRLGFFNMVPPFFDGIDRKMPLFISQNSLLYPSLALTAAMIGDSNKLVAGQDNLRKITVRGKRIPLDGKGQMYVNFDDSIPVYSLTDVRKSHRQWLLGKAPSINGNAFKGRTVFIGNTALSLGDFGITPLSARELMGRSPNVMMHAAALSTILEGTAITAYGRPYSLLYMALVLLIMGALFYFLPAQAAFPLSVVLIGSGIMGGQWLYARFYFLPVLEGSCAGGLFCLLSTLVVYVEKEMDRKYLYAVFGQYLSPRVIEDMYRRQIKPKLGGAEVNATAFFSDIEDFSKFSEALSPSELVNHLNEYFSVMTTLLLEQNGTLDKFIGDSIAAFFGAPSASPAHAFDACMAAVKMQEALAGLRAKWQQSGHLHESAKNLKMRIGINSGNFVAGNIGCEIRMNYTMIGDTVNLASRIEGAAKEYGVYTLVGEETYQAVKNDFRFRRLDRVQVWGRGKPTFIYQLMGAPREEDEQMLALIKTFEEALAAYMDARFSDAHRLFEESLKLEKFPDLKNPSQVMLERSRHFLKIMPHEWDGVFRLKEK
jgi:Adenylate cyclase, family 3 (some proteins contain HAMP domain)